VVEVEVEADFFGHSKHLSMSKASKSKEPPVHVYPKPPAMTTEQKQTIMMTTIIDESSPAIIIICAIK
jgi:hypothetical protein